MLEGLRGWAGREAARRVLRGGIDYAPFARAMLWKLGYAVLPPEELERARLRIVSEAGSARWRRCRRCR
jgi:hypothetical protein